MTDPVTSNPLGDLLRRLREDGGRYLLSVAMTREERDAQTQPTYGGKGNVRWLTDEEYAALCALADRGSSETNEEQPSMSPAAVPRHPIQPLVRDKQGVLRFKANAVVRRLIDSGVIDLNDLSPADFPREDWDQFHQLIGYSHKGIPDINDEVWHAAEAMHKAGISELEARCNYLRGELDAIRRALRKPIALLYGFHPDDLKEP